MGGGGNHHVVCGVFERDPLDRCAESAVGDVASPVRIVHSDFDITDSAQLGLDDVFDPSLRWESKVVPVIFGADRASHAAAKVDGRGPNPVFAVAVLQ